MKLTDNDFRLCFVRIAYEDREDHEPTHVAYFTSQPIVDQWGDDWGDAPYEHNAGPPYAWRPEPEGLVVLVNMAPLNPWIAEVTPVVQRTSLALVADLPYEIRELEIRTQLETPAEWACANSDLSVRDINTGLVAWLTEARTVCEPGPHGYLHFFAGCTLADFRARLSGHGEIVSDEPFGVLR